MFVSALTGDGIAPLLAEVERALALNWEAHELLFPPGAKGLLREAYACSLVESASYGPEGVTLRFKTQTAVADVKALTEWGELVPPGKREALRRYLPGVKGHPPAGE